MQTLTTRLSLPTAALMAASIVAVTPPPPAFTALPAPVVHSVQVPDIQFAATVADILQFPAFKQWVINQITDVVTIGVGLAKAGQGVQQTITAIPSLVVTVTQQILARDPVGALGTIEKGVIGAVTVIGGPILAAVIQRDQRALAVDQALVQAIPAALIGLGTGLVAGFNDFAVAAITAGQNVVAALLPLNIGNVITAVVDGIQLVAQGLSTGAGKVVDGIVFAQQTIAKALATQPAVPVAAIKPTATAAVTATALPNTAAVVTQGRVIPLKKPAPTAANVGTSSGTTETGSTADSRTPGTRSSKAEKEPQPKANKTRTPKSTAATRAAA
ncbi:MULTISPECIES: hypothetical protein [unclassified Mycolicibacterium]|uniref:hypothetical protein n=1 Tax=unclassified Mycolicibacterium TaxID=2636767 RepID=UPI0012DD2E87|nr:MULTISPECIES: hypothetical protein [unclassified Mycolicibacterium]